MACEAATYDEEFAMFYNSATQALIVTLTDEVEEGVSIELGVPSIANMRLWAAV